MVLTGYANSLMLWPVNRKNKLPAAPPALVGRLNRNHPIPVLVQRRAKPVGEAAALVCLVAGLFGLAAPRVMAQELSPRTFWPAPKGTKLAVLGYSYSTGDVLMDPSIPVYGVDSKVNTSVLAYMQAFSLAGRTANALMELPYSWGTSKGYIATTPVSSDFSGLGDINFTLAVNLLGAPSLSLSDYQELRANPRPIVGASVKVVTPTGHYEEDRLINVGANRWAVKPKLGLMLPLHEKWLLELETSTWFFSDDEDYLAGRREQDPIFAAEMHLVKRLKPGFWASLDVTYFTGGRQTIGGNRLADTQDNVKLGGTVVVPFLGPNAIKAGYSASVVTKYGNDFHQFLLAYQRVF